MQVSLTAAGLLMAAYIHVTSTLHPSDVCLPARQQRYHPAASKCMYTTSPCDTNIHHR
jgi:hypothetical protein